MVARGTPLAGGGVAGTWLYTWTVPPRIVWQGWVATGTVWSPTESWMNGVQLHEFLAHAQITPTQEAQ